MKNISIKVIETCFGDFEFGLCKDNEILMVNAVKVWQIKSAAIRNAKAMAESLGIPYSDEIIKKHGC